MSEAKDAADNAAQQNEILQYLLSHRDRILDEAIIEELDAGNDANAERLEDMRDPPAAPSEEGRARIRSVLDRHIVP